ncbi:MAG: hypothetical protein BAJALOKI2v1_30101 [Promethearchaeota archaeon]|nr:MAG: hypothetical protein BAJALOKI2v1_30101 [Candidatus Lokiarchaeota archaeon]
MPDLDDIDKITENLYIGAYWPQLNFKKIKREKIKAIVNLMEENLYDPQPDFEYLFAGFPDNTYPPHETLDLIFNFIEEKIQENKRVLVHCAMGISRSGGICTGYLLKLHPNWTWKDAVNHIEQVHEIMPALEIKKSILDYLELIEGYERK